MTTTETITAHLISIYDELSPDGKADFMAILRLLEESQPLAGVSPAPAD